MLRREEREDGEVEESSFLVEALTAKLVMVLMVVVVIQRLLVLLPPLSKAILQQQLLEVAREFFNALLKDLTEKTMAAALVKNNESIIFQSGKL